MNKNLPKKLKKEPLLDAVFEVRFHDTNSASLLLPSVLFSQLDGNKTIEALPMASFPKNVRDADQNLKFQPISRLSWGQFFINISDFSVSISCQYPYPGWGVFKPAIIKLLTVVSGSGVSKSIERYSMKYIDMIPSTDNREKISMINCDVTLAGHKLKNEAFFIRIDIPRNGLLNTVQVASTAKAILLDGTTREGLIVDVDTASTQNVVSMESLFDGLSEKLDAIHQTNKAVFFDCITQATLKSLEPIYE